MSQSKEISSLSYTHQAQYERQFKRVLKHIAERDSAEKEKRRVTPQVIKEIATLMEVLQKKKLPTEMLPNGWVATFRGTNAFMDIEFAWEVINGKDPNISKIQDKTAQEYYAEMDENIRIIYQGEESLSIRQIRDSGTIMTFEYERVSSAKVKKGSFAPFKEGTILDARTADILIHHFLETLRGSVAQS